MAFHVSGRVRVTRPDPRVLKKTSEPTRPVPSREIPNASSHDPNRPARFDTLLTWSAGRAMTREKMGARKVPQLTSK